MDIFDSSPKSHIFSAAAKNDTDELVELLDANPLFNVNEKDCGNQTLLHYAAKNNNFGMAKILLQRKADANMASITGETPIETLSDPDTELFLLLSEHSNPDVVQKFLTLQETIYGKMDAAILAIGSGDLEKLKLIIKIRKLDINQQDDYGWTLLHWATHYKKAPIVKFLLENKADPNIPNRLGYIPIEFQNIYSEKCDIFKMLQVHSAPKKVRAQLQFFKDLEPARLLMRQAISAIEKADFITVKKCFAQGLDINFQDHGGWTLLHWAACYGQSTIAKKLVDMGADPSIDSNYACPTRASHLVKDRKGDWGFLKQEPLDEQKDMSLGLTTQYKQYKNACSKTEKLRSATNCKSVGAGAGASKYNQAKR